MPLAQKAKYKMTLTTHAVIGAVIGAATGNPILGFLLGFASHFIVDMIPHGDRELYEGHKSKHNHKRAYAYVTVDGIIAVMIVALMVAFSHHTLSLTIALGVIGSVLPDLIIGIHEAFHVKSLKWFHKLHFFFHNMLSDKYGDVPLRYALIAQIIFIIGIQRLF